MKRFVIYSAVWALFVLGTLLLGGCYYNARAGFVRECTSNGNPVAECVNAAERLYPENLHG